MKLLSSIIVLISLVACAIVPSKQQIQTAILQTQSVSSPLNPTVPSTSTATVTTVPTKTATKTKTPTKAASSTPKPTKTLIPGTFRSPAPLGMKIQRDTGNQFKKGHNVVMSAAVLDVKRGEEADLLVRNDPDVFLYEAPIQGQEYLAVQILFEVSKANEYEPFSLYRSWQVALVYEQDGDFLFPIDDLLYADTPTEGFAPLSATYWVYFLVKEGTSPLLYFQPLLYVVEKSGGETDTGAYFYLE